MMTSIPPEAVKTYRELTDRFMEGLGPIFIHECSETKITALRNVIFNCCVIRFQLRDGVLVSAGSSENTIEWFVRSIRDSMDMHPYRKTREDAVEEAVEKVLIENTITFPL